MSDNILFDFNPPIRCHQCWAPILYDTTANCTVYHCLHFEAQYPYSRASINKEASYINVPSVFYDAFSDSEVKP